MRLGDLLHCSRAIITETGSDAFPYRFIGAGVLCSYEDIGFLLTAKHVVKDAEPESLLVLPTDSAVESIPLLAIARVEGDASYQDLAFFPFWRSDVDRNAPGWSDNAIPITEQAISDGRNGLREGVELTLAGMPSAVRNINHDQKTIIQAHALLRARYDAPDGGREGIHRGRLLDTAGLQSFDGFSGGAVLRISSPVWGFAGCVIEGTISSGLFHFIDSVVVWNAAPQLRRTL